VPLAFTNSPAEFEALPEIRKFSYHRNDLGGFGLVYRGEKVSSSFASGPAK
jgi:hypothetical protein